MELIRKRIMGVEATIEEHTQSLAKTLVAFARLVGQREDKVTPFEEEASKNGYDFKGEPFLIDRR